MIDAAVKIESHFEQVAKRHVARDRRVLFRQGGYLRTTMQRAFRYGKKASKPGSPPNAHKPKALLRDRVKFDVDEAAGSVVCGPEIYGGSKVQSNVPLPELLDGGGDIRAELHGTTVTEHVAPRPFTAPVFSDGGENFLKLIEKEPL